MLDPIEESALSRIPTIPLLMMVLISYLAVAYLAKWSSGFFRWKAFIGLQILLISLSSVMGLHWVLSIGLCFFSIVVYCFKLAKYF